MRHLRIVGLGDEDPGDVVGAVTGEADVTNEVLGDVQVDGDRATVEVDPDAADEVAEALDGEQVGASRVRATLLGAEAAEAVADYVDEWTRLVELERREEMRRHEEEIRSLTGREREAKGRALLDLRARDEGESIEGHLVKFIREGHGEALPETEIGPGDLVMVSKEDPLRSDNPTGTVVRKGDYVLVVAFDHPLPDWADRGVRVDLYVNDITYQRMKDALAELEVADGRLAELRDVLVGRRDPAPAASAEVEAWTNPALDETQREAVRRALGADDAFLVHGPPGTGKTTTLVEAAAQHVDRGRSVLATAASNVAVDNLVEFLHEAGVDAVRVGHPARVTPALHEHTLDARLEDHPTYRESERLRQEALDRKDEQDDLTAPSGRWRRGMSDERIRELAREGRGSRGVPPDRIREMAQWLDLQDEADELFAESDRLEDEAIEEVLEAADVVCTTNSTSGSWILAGHAFDVVAIDEATQATEPSCLIPLVKADRILMAGDHHQLPPTVQSREAQDEGLDETLFERLARAHGDDVAGLLEVQHRMHRDLQDFPSEAFYDGRLRPDEAVADHTLADLGVERGDLPVDLEPVLDPATPVTFLDTSGVDAPERSRPGSPSRENPSEAQAVARLAEALLGAGLDPADLAVISPYDDQVDLLDRALDPEALEVDTVDGFQGREKEAVIVSLVRSNPRDQVGFLADERRLNVALTRARRKLVVVGDADTVAAHPTYRDLLDHVRDRGRVVDLAELDA